jgi:predicted O-methyltransferase YrrM
MESLMTTIHGCGNSMKFYDFLTGALPAGAKVLEMGVFYGRGLVHLAKNSQFEIYGVDQFIRSEMPYQLEGVNTDQDFYEACLRNLFEAGAIPRVTLIALPSRRAAQLFKDEALDCVFLDANHGYEAVASDIVLWKSKVKRGGFLAGDDYVEPWGGVIKAVDESFPNRSLLGHTWLTRL